MYDQHDLLELLNRQKQLYDRDILKWQNAFEMTTTLIQQVRVTQIDRV